MRKLIFMTAVFMAALSFHSSEVYAQQANDKYAKTLYQMMDKSGGLEAVKLMVPQLVNMMKQQSPSLPNSFWEDFTKRWTQQFIDKMLERTTPIYQKYLTQKDLEAILAFYNTPAGRKLSASTPTITKEAMQKGQQLGMEIGQQMQNEIANMKSK